MTLGRPWCEVCALLPDHDGGGVGIAADDFRHDGRVDNSEFFNATAKSRSSPGVRFSLFYNLDPQQAFDPVVL
jgi:hypothetical protein